MPLFGSSWHPSQRFTLMMTDVEAFVSSFEHEGQIDVGLSLGADAPDDVVVAAEAEAGRGVK